MPGWQRGDHVQTRQQSPEMAPPVATACKPGGKSHSPAEREFAQLRAQMPPPAARPPAYPCAGHRPPASLRDHLCPCALLYFPAVPRPSLPVYEPYRDDAWPAVRCTSGYRCALPIRLGKPQKVAARASLPRARQPATVNSGRRSSRVRARRALHWLWPWRQTARESASGASPRRARPARASAHRRRAPAHPPRSCPAV